MKQIEKLATEFVLEEINPSDQIESPDQTNARCYEAGFRKARDIVAQKAIQGRDYSIEFQKRPEAGEHAKADHAFLVHNLNNFIGMIKDLGEQQDDA